MGGMGNDFVFTSNKFLHSNTTQISLIYDFSLSIVLKALLLGKSFTGDGK